MYTKDKTEEQVLIMRAQRGEQDAFRVLVERYQSLVYTLALRMVGNPQDAEDVAQEAFLGAWKGLPAFRLEAQFSTWLYRLTVNAATDLLRRRKKEAANRPLEDENGPIDLPDPSPGPEELAEQTERREVLRRGIAALSENHRAILLLRVVNGLDYAAIGEILELTPGTVKSRLARARKELREILRREGNLSPGTPSKQSRGGEGE